MVIINELSELAFEERTHKYLLNGISLPSVTKIMNTLSSNLYSGIDEKVLARAADKGTAVHNAIDNYIRFGIDDISPELEGYYIAFKCWMNEHQVKPYGTEIKLYHKALMYAGTADMVAEVDGVDTLIDFKTTTKISEMLAGVQLSAYEKAFQSQDNGFEVRNRIIVHLSNDGKYKVISFNNTDECWRVFMALLTVRNYEQKFS